MSLEKSPTNQEIAELLREVAAVLKVKKADLFRTRAYSVAADSIEKESSSLYTLWKNDQLEDIPNIGKKLTKHIAEYFKTGTPTYLNNLKKRVPAGMFPLLKIDGIGPWFAYKIAKNLNLNSQETSLSNTLEAAKAGKIAKIDDLGEKIQQKLIEVIKAQPQQEAIELTEKERIRIDIAENIAMEILAYLNENADVVNSSTLGSLRRKKPTIGDIDLGVATSKPKSISAAIKKFSNNQKTISAGESLVRFQHKIGYGVDVKIVKPKEWGSLLQHFTGSKTHNIQLRKLAQKKGLSLSEYGIKNVKTEKIETFKTEESFYKYLDLPWIPPEIRENDGEIELAKKNKLPKLIELEDIKGDFHVHSDAGWESGHDEGKSTLESTIKAAVEKGYSFIGIADHNPSSQYVSHKMKQLLAQRDQIFKQLRKKFPKITIYNALEVDIGPDGSLALSDEDLEGFDYVIASIHSSFSLDKIEMTNRILKALNHKKIKILGHPTGKMLYKRPGYDLDWDKILPMCKKLGVALEVNSSPIRLDIDEVIVKHAIKNGVKIAINTDAHSINHLDFMKYGVYVARRGFAIKKDCLNCSENPIT